MRKKEYMCKYKKCLSNDNVLMRYMDVSGLQFQKNYMMFI